MARRISPVPERFANKSEKDYWHSTQDIAYRAGMSLVLRDGSAWIVSDEGERLVCEPQIPGRIWFETWLALHDEYGRLSRLWVGGRPVTEPGE